MEISKQALELALEEYEDNHDEPLSVRTDYRGRGMYGRQCVGVVGNAGDLLRFVLEIVPAIDPNKLAAPGDSDIVYSEEWFNVHYDSMGLDMIFYWPTIEVVEDTPDDEHPADAAYDGSNRD